MFLDINGNTFSTLGNTNKTPTLNHLPNQIFGKDLMLWVDFTDKSTLYTDTGLTTNVTTYGDYIRGIRDKSYRNKSLRLSNPISASTNWQWSSNTLNNLGCCLRTDGIPTAYDASFLHSDSTFLVANTNYSVYFVARIQGTTNTPGLYTYSLLNNQLSFTISPQSIGMVNGANQTIPIFTLPDLTKLTIGSINFNFTGSTAADDRIESFRDNNYSPINAPSFNIGYTSSSLKLFTRYGTSPQYASPVINFFCQEIIFASGFCTTQQLNFIHQYLRLKYL